MRDILWITGAAGFSGRHLAAHVGSLEERPYVVGIDRSPDACSAVDEYMQAELSDTGLVADLASRRPPRWVIHLAGMMPPDPDAQLWRVNVGGTMSLLLGLHTGGASGTRLVSVGSAAEYAPSGREVVSESCAVVGPSAYGRSKWAQGAVALSLGGQLGIEVIVLRTFNLIGPGLSSRFVAGWLCAQFAGADYTGVLKAGNLHSARDFVDVRDAVNAYWLAAREGKAGQAYNVCSGKATTVEELIGLLSEITGLRPRVEVDPERVRGATDVGVWGTFDKLRLATGWYPRIGLRRSLEDMLAELPGHDRC